LNLFYNFMIIAQEAGEKAPEGAQDGGGGNPLSVVFLFAILLGIMYVFLILPQKKREKKHRAMVSQLKKNDHIVTAGGIHGVVMSVKDNSVVIKIDESKDVRVTISTGSISQVIDKSEQGKEDGKSS